MDKIRRERARLCHPCRESPFNRSGGGRDAAAQSGYGNRAARIRRTAGLLRSTAESRRVDNGRMLRELRVQLEYGDLDRGIRASLDEHQAVEAVLCSPPGSSTTTMPSGGYQAWHSCAPCAVNAARTCQHAASPPS